MVIELFLAVVIGSISVCARGGCSCWAAASRSIRLESSSLEALTSPALYEMKI